MRQVLVSRSAVVSILLMMTLILLGSCRTEIPFEDEMLPDDQGSMPVDSTGGDLGDPGGMDPGSDTDDACDSSVVYFEQQVLPIFIGSCAYAGCHTGQQAPDGIRLDSYEGITAEDDLVVPFDLDDSDIYKKITEDDEDDRMPPPPNARLQQSQIQLIASWINQGAKNNSCTTGCDTTEVSYSIQVKPIIDNYCASCHSATNPNGGVTLVTHEGLLGAANSGKLLGSIQWSMGFIPMPFGGEKIPTCEINLLKAWVNQGGLDN